MAGNGVTNPPAGNGPIGGMPVPISRGFELGGVEGTAADGFGTEAGVAHTLFVHVCPPAHVPQLSVPLQPSEMLPQFAPFAAHVVGVHAGVQTLPVHVCPPEHVPQLSVAPQPSEMLPQFAFSAAQVVGVQWQRPQSLGHVAQVSLWSHTPFPQERRKSFSTESVCSVGAVLQADMAPAPLVHIRPKTLAVEVIVARM
jgi:hypothetical protein